MDGIYNLDLQTKMGKINANIKLITKGNELTGYVEAMGQKNEFSGGKVQGSMCYLSGKIKTMIISINYEIQGELKGDILYIHAKTNMGNFDVEAKRIA